MRVIARSTLREFWECPEYADSQGQLEAWCREAKQAQWSDPMEVKAQYGTASILKGGRVVFNIVGDKYCLVWGLTIRRRLFLSNLLARISSTTKLTQKQYEQHCN
jgi:mRNA interferase HigB